ncbi:NB-ARC domain-containing protein [Microcystis aeruginosa]|uniref:Apoptotic protease-activating factor 1 like n=1 Tax=Microcystis aeruginosa PCC 9443 TaxID=1160281 RepID=I4G7U5_MICAE
MAQFQPDRALEIVAPKYGTAYRIGGRLLLTCRHLFDNSNNCKVRLRSASNYSDKQDIDAKVIWKAPDNIDIALVELPETIETCDPVGFGLLPDSNSGEKVKFEFLGWPEWGFIKTDKEKKATRLHIEGIIYIADVSPDGLLVLEVTRKPSILEVEKANLEAEQTKKPKSPWQGTSGAAIVCNGLVVGVQKWHQNPDRPASLEAESLARVYDNPEWCEILENHDIDPEPKPVISASLKSSSYRNQAPPKPSYFVERPEVSIELEKLLLSETTEKTGTLVISAIYGLGGIGKSTLAAALAQEKEVQAYFPDGIFWATLGQQPDILSFLHGWIQALGDYNFKPTGIDAASLHLRTLFADKKALLVVDDLWNVEDIDPFRVAVNQCKLLVTTREVPVKGAIRYDLDVMMESQSLALLTGYLRKELTAEEEAQGKNLAKIVVYLPLALELGAAQVKDGVSWAELLEDLQAEIAHLEVLDQGEAEDFTNQEKRKSYSLIASFNLSLKRLNGQRLRQFSWLGVLPDDVTITEKMAATLWDCPVREARQTLRYLRGKALLLTGVSSELLTSYRVHDLLHDLARNLILASPHPETDYQLPGLGLSMAEAHQQLLQRYQKQTKNGLWHTLADDGYIYNQLLWHLEKAQQIAQIHLLLREETAEGHNGWYSQCEREGKTAVFIKDVSRAWQLAEGHFIENKSESMGLQVRYALITTSLNSLAGNIPPELIAALIKHEIWTPAQGLAYVRQSQDSSKQAEGLEKITPYLPPTLLPEALEIARGIGDESYRAKALTGLAPHLPESLLPETLEVAREIGNNCYVGALTRLAPHLPESLLPEALKLAREIGNERFRAEVLTRLAPHLPESLLPEALKLAREIGNERFRAEALTGLASYLPEVLPEALEFARGVGLEFATEVGDERFRAKALTRLAPHLPEVLPEALEFVRAIGKFYVYSHYKVDESYFPGVGGSICAEALTGLAPYLSGSLLPEALEVVRAIGHEHYRVEALTGLAPYLPESLLPEALEIAREIGNDRYAEVLTGLAPHLPQNLLPEALEIARAIKLEGYRAEALTELVPYLPEVLPEALAVARGIGDEYFRAKALTRLASHLPEVLPEALAVARRVGDEHHSAGTLILTGLAVHLSKSLLPKALKVTRAISDAFTCARALTGLAPHLMKIFLPKALKVARAKENEYSRARALTVIAHYFPEVLPEALEAARAIENLYDRVLALTGIGLSFPEVLPEALKVAKAIGNEYYCAKALTELVPYLPEVLPEALEVARTIGNGYEYYRVKVLTGLAPHLPQNLLPEALEIARAIKLEGYRAEALTELVPYLPEVLPEALAVARTIGSESSRAEALQGLTKVLTPANVDLSLWEKTLQALGTLTRSSFLETIPNLVPLILHFGGVVALREVYQGIREVSRWWK